MHQAIIWTKCWNIVEWTPKVRSHLRGAVAGRRGMDFGIPSPLPRVCSHICGADTDLSFVEDEDGLEHAVSKQTRKIGCWSHLLWSGFWSRSASAPRPRMCECMQWFALKPIFRPASTPCMCERSFRNKLQWNFIVEVWKWLSKFIPHFTGHVIMDPYWD